MRRLLEIVRRAFTRSVRTQLVVGIALVHAVLMSIFVIERVDRERAFLDRQAREQVASLADTLATTTASWVLANDVAGLQEVIQSLASYPDLRYAMVLSPEGQVLAHTNPIYIGLYAQDEVSRRLLAAPPAPYTLVDSSQLADVASPIRMGNRMVGWARVGLGRAGVTANLRQAAWSGAAYTLTAIVAGILFAFLMARQLTRGITALVAVADQVRVGRHDVRVERVRDDELGRLGDGFNLMLDALGEQRERLQLILDSTAEGIFGLDTEGRFVFCNRAALAFLGYEVPEDILGQDAHVLIHHTHADGSHHSEEACRIRYAIHRGEGQHVTDEVFWRRDGRAIPVEYWAYPIQHNTRALGAVVAFLDITERRAAEQALRQSEEKFAKMFHSSPDMIVLTRLSDGRYIDVNEAFERILGYSRADALGQTALSLGVWADPRERKAVVDRLAQGETVRNHEVRFRHRDGHVLYGLLSSEQVEFGGESCILSIWRDISEHRQMVEALRRSEEKFSKIFRASPDLITISTVSDNRFVEANPAVEDLLGYGREEILGRTATELGLWENETSHQRFVEAARQEGRVVNMEVGLRRRDGKILTCLVSVDVIEFAGEQCLLAIVRDISERKEAELMLARKSEELARSNAELERFAYVASHDLQEPLRMVGSYVQLLARRYQGKLDADADEFIHYAVDGAERMRQLINDLLAYSRVSTRGREFAPVALGEALDDALANLRHALEENGATVEHGDLPTVEGDSSQLAQLFQNLISNALKFRSEAPPRIRVEATRQDREWVVAVSDNGIGIAPEHFERIFIMFQRLHNREAYPGTGIGLALCKRIVERHGGRIWVESEPGQGSVFRFTLPVRDNEQESP